MHCWLPVMKPNQTEYKKNKTVDKIKKEKRNAHMEDMLRDQRHSHNNDDFVIVSIDCFDFFGLIKCI